MFFRNETDDLTKLKILKSQEFLDMKVLARRKLPSKTLLKPLGGKF